MTPPRRRQPARPRPTRSARRTLLLVVFAVAMPAVLSAILYSTDWRPSGRSLARGELMQPVRPLPATPGIGQGTWQLLTLAETSCSASCQQALFATQTARLMLGKDMRRVERVLLVRAVPAAEIDALRERFSGQRVYHVPAESYQNLHRFMLDTEREASGWIFLIDPAGNFVLRYAPGSDPRSLHKDLGRLLRLSQIG